VAKLIEYDVSNVEASGGGGTEQPKQGVYTAKIAQCRQRDTKADGTPANDIMVALDLGANYAWVYTYIGLGEAADWKMAEFIRAVGLKEKGKLDPDKMVGKLISVKINPDSYDGEYRGRAGRLMKAAKGAKILDADADGAGPDEDDDDEPTAEAEPSSEFEPTREDPEDDEVGSYDDWDDSDLEAEVEERGVTVPGGRGSKRSKWIAALRSDDINEMDEEGGEDEAEQADDEYDTFALDELVSEVTDRELELPRKPRGSNAEERYKAKLIEVLRADDEAEPF